MTGSSARKTLRLLSHLLIQPRYVPRYVQTNLFGRASALDVELPWISYAAIDFLSGFVRPEMTVFEYGSGGSTLYFARRCASVISIEDNADWFRRVRERLVQQQIHNVDLQCRPFDFHSAIGFENSEYLNAIPNQKFDIILVDGTEQQIQVRPTCFAYAANFVRPGGVIIVDDSWRYPGLRDQNHAKEARVFQSVGPCRPGVTSTDIFFY
jgi:predicted O-methyltransferase YrrM